MAFIDAKCGALDAASKAICNQIEASDDLRSLQRICEQMESIGGRIEKIFGTASPEANALQNLWIMLRHDLSVMEKQAAAPA